MFSNHIQVSGITWFPPERWREAILYYLFGLWSNKGCVAYRPKIRFGSVVLRLDEPKTPHPLLDHETPRGPAARCAA